MIFQPKLLFDFVILWSMNVCMGWEGLIWALQFGQIHRKDVKVLLARPVGIFQQPRAESLPVFLLQIAPADQFPTICRQQGPPSVGTAGEQEQWNGGSSRLCMRAGEPWAGELGSEDPERERGPPCSWQGTSHSCGTRTQGTGLQARHWDGSIPTGCLFYCSCMGWARGPG